MSRRNHPRLRALGLLLFVGAPMAGALAAALVLPWVVGPGLAVRSSADLVLLGRRRPGELIPANQARRTVAPGSIPPSTRPSACSLTRVARVDCAAAGHRWRGTPA